MAKDNLRSSVIVTRMHKAKLMWLFLSLVHSLKFQVVGTGDTLCKDAHEAS